MKKILPRDSRESLYLTEQLFRRFNAIWGNKWMAQVADKLAYQEYLLEWSQAIQGWTMDVMAKALDHCKLNLEWPPSIAQFIGICEEVSGVPTLDQAYRTIFTGTALHPVVEHALSKLDTYHLRMASGEKAYKMFKNAYREARADYRLEKAKQALLEEAS